MKNLLQAIRIRKELKNLYKNNKVKYDIKGFEYEYSKDCTIVFNDKTEIYAQHKTPSMWTIYLDTDNKFAYYTTVIHNKGILKSVQNYKKEDIVLNGLPALIIYNSLRKKCWTDQQSNER